MHDQICRKLIPGVIGVLISVSACTDSGSPTFSGPAPLPLLRTMQAQTTLFDTPHAGSGSNYNQAAAVIAAATAATTASMPTAVTVFSGAAGAADPEQQSDGFHWLYTVTSGNNTFDVDLRARTRGVEDAVWEARVISNTTTPPLSDFVLFTGRSDLTEFAGEWRIFDASTPSTPTALLDVFWSTESSTTWRTVFRNIRTGSPNVGDFLDYEAANDTRRVSYFDESVGEDGLLTVVEWNATTTAGYIRSGADQRLCWNSLLQNVTCTI
jgi:hypothetical protein